MRRLLLCCLIGLFHGCSHPGQRGRTGADEIPPLSPALLRALTLPPGSETEAALAQLASAAKGGSCEAAWSRARYALDLFDTVRLHRPVAPSAGGFGAAHSLLWRVLQLPGEPGRGRLATIQVVEALQRSVKPLPESCPHKDSGLQALKLLETDLAPRRTVSSALPLAVRLKQIARSPSPLSPNAQLRLFDWCFSAFKLAAGGPPAQQHIRLNHCLLALFDADPTPYFNPDPLLRPPDPPWPLLRRGLEGVLIPLKNTRHKALAGDLSAALSEFFSTAGAALPTPLDLSRFTPPISAAGVPWDRTPIIVYTGKGYIVGGAAVLEHDLEGLQAAIARRLKGDLRRRVTLMLRPSDPARAVMQMARAARLAGAGFVDLGTAQQVALVAPSGDVQRAVFGNRPVMRLHGVPLSTTPLSARAVPPPPRDRPRGMEYDPRTAPSSLALFVDRGGSVRVSSRDGVLGPLRFTEVVSTLRSLREVYTQDTSMLIIPLPSATYGELTSLVGMVRRHQGQPLFPGLALAAPGHASHPDVDLAPLLRLLSRAQVKEEPPISRTWPDQLRLCYMEGLRLAATKPGAPPKGTLVIKRTRKGFRVSHGTLRDKATRACVSRTLDGLPATEVSRITVTFSLSE